MLSLHLLRKSWLKAIPSICCLLAASGCGFASPRGPAKLQGQQVPSFGTNQGYTPLGGAFTPGKMVPVSANRAVLIGTMLSGSSLLLATTEIDSDGKVDENYGTLGLATAPLGTETIFDGGMNFSTAGAGLLQSDGKLVVAATADLRYCGPSVLARFLPSGALDTSFGGQGTGVSAGFNACVNSLEFLPNGQILAMGGYPGINAARFNSDGTLDTSFGSAGIATIPSQPMTMSNYNYGTAEANGSFFLYGMGSSSLLSGIGLAHFDANGILDPHYGSSGESIAQIANLENIWGGVVTGGDLVVLASTSQGTIQSMNGLIAGFNSAGNLDTSFGQNGSVPVIFNSQFGGFASCIISDYWGNIYVGGTTNLAAPNPNMGGIVQVLPSQMTIFRFLRNGALDTTFGQGGRLDYRIGTSTGLASMSFTADGNALQVLGTNDQNWILTEFK